MENTSAKSKQSRTATTVLHFSQLGPVSRKDPVVMSMERANVPLSRKNYLVVAGLEEPLDAENELQMPVEFRKPNG